MLHGSGHCEYERRAKYSSPTGNILVHRGEELSEVAEDLFKLHTLDASERAALMEIRNILGLGIAPADPIRAQFSLDRNRRRPS
jgi:hypothetical protein